MVLGVYRWLPTQLTDVIAFTFIGDSVDIDLLKTHMVTNRYKYSVMIAGVSVQVYPHDFMLLTTDPFAINIVSSNLIETMPTLIEDMFEEFEEFRMD